MTKKNKIHLRWWGYVLAGLVALGLIIVTRGGILGLVFIVFLVVTIKRTRARERAKALAAIPPPPPKPRQLKLAGLSVLPENMRVTDQERDECAEELSKQFQVGRLDQATFDQRLNLALSATRRYELDLMLADLPVSGLPRSLIAS